MGLVSGLALISSDWLVEMKSTFAFFVCSLIAICTCAARPPDDELAPFLLDELLRPLSADLRLELVVADEHLDLAAEDAALGVELVDGQLRALLHVGSDGAERPGERRREPDPDRILALRAQHRGEGEGRGAGGRGGQKTRDDSWVDSSSRIGSGANWRR